MAKLYAVPEGRLREVVAAPPEVQRELLLAAIEQDLTAQELRQRAEGARARKRGGDRARPAQSTHQKAARRLRSFLKLTRSPGFGEGFEQVAVELSLAAAEAEELLEAAERLEAQAHWLRVMYQRRQ